MSEKSEGDSLERKETRPKISKPKPLTSVASAISWYYGNFIHSPNNALRGDEWLPEGAEEEMKKIAAEIGDRKLTHKEFLDIVKTGGFHDKYYRYKKYENNCPICRHFGIR